MEYIPADAIIMMAIGLFITGFLITRGALELMALIMVPVAVMAVLTIRALFPAELIWLMAAAITGAAFVGLKDRPGVNFFFLSAALAVVMLGAKVYLPAALLTRLALTIVFLGILKFLVF